jgi:hypothetical protein
VISAALLRNVLVNVMPAVRRVGIRFVARVDAEPGGREEVLPADEIHIVICLRQNV